MLSPSSVVGSRSEKRRLIVTAVPQRKKPNDKRLNGCQKAEEKKRLIDSGVERKNRKWQLQLKIKKSYQ